MTWAWRDPDEPSVWPTWAILTAVVQAGVLFALGYAYAQGLLLGGDPWRHVLVFVGVLVTVPLVPWLLRRQARRS